MAKRRSVILGLGALAFGSGAMSVNAALQDFVDPAGDMRVVANQNLTVEAGASFRNSDGNYVSGRDGPKFYGEDNGNFFSDGSPSTNQDDDLANLSLGDLPAIFVNSAEDGNLKIKLALPNKRQKYTFPEALQVRNDGTTDEEVAVKFREFGADTDGPQNGNGGVVSEDDVVGAFRFIDNANGREISPNRSGFDASQSSLSVKDQIPAHSMTVKAGKVRQVDLTVNFDITEISIVEDIQSTSPGNPFANNNDTFQLVKTVRFGVNPDATTES